jgi:hypothetical protein
LPPFESEDINYDYHEHMALAAKKFWGGEKAR